MKPAALAAAACLVTVGAAAQTAEPETRVLVGVERSHLDHGFAPWTELSLGVSRRADARRMMEATVLETRRFGIKDTQVGVAFSTSLSPPLTLSADGTFSPSHHVLARHALGATLQYEFAPAWLVHGGLRYTRYDNATVERGTVMLEHYFGDFSASTGWYPARTLGTHADAFDVRAAWYYGDRSSAGIVLARGDEATQTGPGTVVLAPVRSLALTGRHALDPKMGLTWSLFRVRQGSFYTRQGASAGVQVAF